ncbi:MAG: FG-GAP-like repeat-containing protein [Pyrinomonadaceae bacterium]
MSKTQRRSWIALVLLLATLAALPQAGRVSQIAGLAASAPEPVITPEREAAYRLNNLGVALLEQYKHKEGADVFRRALRLDPKLNLARINLAIALLNVPDLPAALREAEAAAQALPDRPQPHYVLGLIYKSQNRADEALKAFRRVLDIDPRDTGANVNLGQLYAQQRNYVEAQKAFRTAFESEPYNGTALYNLATAMLRAGQRAEGQQLMQRFQALRQSGAATTIDQTTYLEQGRYAEAITSTGAEPELVSKQTPEVGYVDATAGALPAGAGQGGEPGSQNARPALGGTFKVGTSGEAAQEVVARLGATGAQALLDFDADGDLDLFVANAGGQQLYRNDAGKFTDVTAQGGALAQDVAAGVALGALAGDFDNDERPDLFVLRHGQSRLYRNEGAGRFADVTAAAGIPADPHLSISAAFVDADHDGDLDIFVAGLADLSKPPKSSTPATADGFVTFPADFAGAPNLLLRNNGNGKFTDVTAAAKVTGAANNHAVAIVPTDYDNRRDVDLLVVQYGAPPVLYRNLRDTTFRDVAAAVGLTQAGPYTCAAAGDVNKDTFTDFYFGAADAPGVFAASDGRGGFKMQAAPSSPGDPANARFATATAAQFLDYDNDGLLDLLTLYSTAQGVGGLSVWRNAGDGWLNESRRAVARDLFDRTSAPRAFVSGDVDADGDADLLVRVASGGLRHARNDGDGRNHSVRVRLAGKVSNRSGVGAKIEARAGSLQQKLETYAATPAPAPADVVFGLGARATTDAVRVLWPAGIVQAETEITPAPAAVAATKGGSANRPRPSSAASLTITELDRKPSSCPYLYAWNGERFEFITDFMGGGELGYWAAPGIRARPDPDEYVRIRGDQLKAKDGRYELRVTNELEEALFLDHLQLVAVAHPEGTEVYPNEGLGSELAGPLKLFATRNAHPPVAARDDAGRDVLPQIARMDRQYPEGFRLHRIRGYADEHALTLDLGQTSAKRTLLLMTGWTDYAFSSDNVAAAQHGLGLQPPSLQVKDGAGKWQTVIKDIGIPVGRPQMVVVDLTGKFLGASREVRVVTNMRIYWDQILVDTSGGDFPLKLSRLAPQIADLRWRGFSAETTPDGREPFAYDFVRVSHTSPWKVMPGRYTREGDVLPLLEAVDDVFVVSRPGDSVRLSFDARSLPTLPAGWTRTFLLYADGYSKEMDINSASPDAVGQYPFHGMTNYPYSAPEQFPWTPARRALAERYNTRVVAAPVPHLVTGDR